MVAYAGLIKQRFQFIRYKLFHRPRRTIHSRLMFIAANLGMGILLSTLAQSQLQAMQMAFFFFLPSMMLSGFFFPFRGMPMWAQTIGSLLPLSHFLRIVRGIVLKGNGFIEVWPQLWPIGLFFLVVMSLAVVRFRRTLD
jgi:ABC-2 type transport system permease protein